MDILCERCGEPWNAYGVRNGDLDPIEQGRFFRGEGCPSCYGKDPSEFADRAERTEVARAAQSAMRDVLGDDIDGLAAMMEDFDLC